MPKCALFNIGDIIVWRKSLWLQW